jgi:hypothetical protein
MSKQQSALAAAAKQALVDDYGYTTAETRRFLPSGKTKFFTDILPQLESYLEGTRRIITGRSIRKLRDAKLAEPLHKRPVEHLPNVKKRRSRKLEESRRTEVRP